MITIIVDSIALRIMNDLRMLLAIRDSADSNIFLPKVGSSAMGILAPEEL